MRIEEAMYLTPARPLDEPATLARSDLSFRSRGVVCRGWLYAAAGARGPSPCVVLAHGFAGVREQGLDAYARRFAAAGISAFVFDYRCFGASDGEPRELVSNLRQVDDWRAAVEFVRTLDRVDPARIALWGTSTSGGHVVKLAAAMPEICAVVTQMPFASGLAQFFSLPIVDSLRLVGAGVKDQLGAWLRAEPKRIPAVGLPRSLAAVTTADALSGLDRITPQGMRPIEVPARFALSTTFYNPGRAAKRLRCPLLVCVADGDDVMPIRPALGLAERAERGVLRRYRFGHFAMYYGDGFDEVVDDQVAFLRRHLLDEAARAERTP
jgi:fermentation-respiration switch protein FrsA (DUF1100 family)